MAGPRGFRSTTCSARRRHSDQVLHGEGHRPFSWVRTGERQQEFPCGATNPLVDVHLGHVRSDIKWRTLVDGRFDVSELFSPPFSPTWLIRRMWRNQVKRRTEPATSARVVIHEEKGSDVNLGVNLVFDAAAGTCGKALVISNDADLEEAVRLARRAGAEVGIVNPPAISDEQTTQEGGRL